MKRYHVPSFLFHVPGTHKCYSADEIQKKMGTRHEPPVVHVVDVINHTRLGAMHPTAALIKFR